MALAAGGIKKTQSEIAKDVYFGWWGTPQDIIYAYLSRFFSKIDFKSNATLSDIETHLKTGHIIIVNWWDDIDPKDADGHYSLILNFQDGLITLADPSEGRDIWETGAEKFEKKWYDYLDLRKKKKIKKWMLWLDPESKI